MRKKIPPSGRPACPPDTDAVLGCGDVTPESHNISESIDEQESISEEEAKKLLRDAIGKLFVKAVEYTYLQRFGKKPQ